MHARIRQSARALGIVSALGIMSMSALLTPACKGEGAGGETTKLPSEFPSVVVSYPGSRVLSTSLDKGVNGKPERKIELTTKDPIDKVRAFYDPAKLSGLTHRAGDATPGRPMLLHDPKRYIDVKVTIHPGGDGTQIALAANLM